MAEPKSRYAVKFKKGGKVRWFDSLEEIERAARRANVLTEDKFKPVLAALEREERRPHKKAQASMESEDDVIKERRRLKEYAGKRNPRTVKFFREAHEKGWLGSSYLFPEPQYLGSGYLPLTAAKNIPDLARINPLGFWDNSISSAWVTGCTILYDRPRFQQGRKCTLVGPPYLGVTRFPTLVADDGFSFDNQASSAEHFELS